MGSLATKENEQRVKNDINQVTHHFAICDAIAGHE